MTFFDVLSEKFRRPDAKAPRPIGIGSIIFPKNNNAHNNIIRNLDQTPYLSTPMTNTGYEPPENPAGPVRRRYSTIIPLIQKLQNEKLHMKTKSLGS